MIRPGTSVNKHTNKSKLGPRVGPPRPARRLPRFEHFLKRHDWVGAVAILELEKYDGKLDVHLWIAYCYFHLGEYKKAVAVYDALLRGPAPDRRWHTYKAVCLYALCNFDQARAEAAKAPESPLKVRLMYQISQKRQDDTTLMNYHHKLSDSEEDQLCVGAIHYFRGHFDDCIELYKKILQQQKRNVALNVYLALCYYRQEFFEISQEIVETYLAKHPLSLFAVNLQACNVFQQLGGAEAEELFKKLEKHYEGSSLFDEHDLLRHNRSVFRGGENALKVFPPLQELYPEAKLNLVIHHLKGGQVEEAFRRTHDMKPLTPREYILKGVVYALYGQLKGSEEHLQTAQQQFQLIGTSATECDTVSGRQCIASYLFLKKQFEDVILYLKTIREFMAHDDSFNWNYGLALAATGKFAQAEEALLLVRAEELRQEYVYNAWLARCFVRGGKPELAWNLYLEMDTSNEIVGFVSLLANECYAAGFFFFALKAFDILERLDNSDYTEAKLGAAAGVFKDFLTNKLLANQMEEAAQILRAGAQSPRVEALLKAVEPFLGDE